MEQVKDILKKEKEVKRIGFRSLKNGEIIICFKNKEDIPSSTLNLQSPGYINSFGNLIIDIF